MSHIYQLTPKNLIKLFSWVRRSNVQEKEQIQSWQELGFVLAAISKIKSREKA